MKWDDSRQEDAWYFGAERIGAAASAAQAGWREYPPDHPPRLADVDVATWEPTARLARMDEYGIWAQVLYPNVAGFGAGKLLTLGDPELMLACVQAYNDFLAEYSSADPRRFVPIMALPMWDIDLCEKEIVRAASLGHKGVIMTGEPTFWGLPPIAERYWDRLWALCQEMGLPVNFHIGSGDMSIFDHASPSAGPHANYAGFGLQFGLANARVIANLITGGVCHRFPGTKFVSVESGVGWIPFALEHLDWQWLNCGVPREHPEYDLLPSEYFKRQMFGCFWFERASVKAAIDQLGAGLGPVRERLPASDEHGARTGDRRRAAARVHRHRSRRPLPRGAPQGAARQRGEAVPPGTARRRVRRRVPMPDYPTIEVDLTAKVARATEHWQEIDALREAHRFFWNSYGSGYWVLTRYDDIREASRRPEIFSNHSIVATDPRRPTGSCPRSSTRRSTSSTAS